MISEKTNGTIVANWVVFHSLSPVVGKCKLVNWRGEVGDAVKKSEVQTRSFPCVCLYLMKVNALCAHYIIPLYQISILPLQKPTEVGSYRKFTTFSSFELNKNQRFLIEIRKIEAQNYGNHLKMSLSLNFTG